MGTKIHWYELSIEFKTGPTYIISPETWEMMINKKMEEE